MAPPPSLYPSNNHALPQLLNVHHKFSAYNTSYSPPSNNSFTLYLFYNEIVV